MRVVLWVGRQAFMLWLIAMCLGVLGVLWVEDRLDDVRERLRHWRAR